MIAAGIAGAETGTEAEIGTQEAEIKRRVISWNLVFNILF